MDQTGSSFEEGSFLLKYQGTALGEEAKNLNLVLFVFAVLPRVKQGKFQRTN